jgi:phospholipid/cholesterol/gamma-HCH transport system substrate-binding protein
MQKIQVGVFLIAGLALIVALFLIVTLRNRQPMETYYIKFTESVSGLAKDCDVLYRGVPVGKVEDIRVTKENETLVTVGIVKSKVTLHKGTTAMLAMSNLMGGMQIELSGGEPQDPVLQPHSYIISRPSIMANVAQDLPKILEDISTILAKIDQSIGDVKADRLGALVRNADTTMQTADKTFAEVTTFLQTTRGTMLNTEYEITQTMRALREAIVQANRVFTRLNEDPSSIFWGRPAPKHPHVR